MKSCPRTCIVVCLPSTSPASAVAQPSHLQCSSSLPARPTLSLMSLAFPSPGDPWALVLVMAGLVQGAAGSVLGTFLPQGCCSVHLQTVHLQTGAMSRLCRFLSQAWRFRDTNSCLARLYLCSAGEPCLPLIFPSSLCPEVLLQGQECERESA